MNKTLKVKHLLLILGAFVLIGAGGGKIFFDNVVIEQYQDFKTPTVTPATGLSGQARIYYDSTNQGLAGSFNGNVATPLMSGRNKIINGNFNVWQRGTGLTTVISGTTTYLADRWPVATNSSANIDESQVTAISGVNGSYNAILIQPHTTNTAGASSSVQIYQVIEGYNLIPLNNQVCTLSFWAKGTVGTYGVSLHDGGASVYYIFDWVVPDTNWHKYVYTFTHSTATGIWNYTNGIGMYVIFSLTTGSGIQGTSGSWQSGNKNGTSNVTNTFTNSTSNFMYLTQVQLELGSSATQFEQLDYQVELARCQRYCFILNGGTAGNSMIGVGCFNASSTAVYVPIVFPVQMRIAPSVSFSGTISHVNIGFASGIVTADTNPVYNAWGATPWMATPQFAKSTGVNTSSPQICNWGVSAGTSDMIIFNSDF